MSGTETKNPLNKYLEEDEVIKAQKEKLDENKAATEKLLQDHYTATKNTLETQKRDQLQAAEISHEKLLKYLPEYNEAMGLYGSGASETALLDAAARHRSSQGAILSEYNANAAAALQDYNAKKLTNQQSYDSDLLDLYTTAKNREEAKQTNIYNTIREGIINGLYDSEKLMNYMASVEGTVTPEQYTDLKAIAGSMIGDDLMYKIENYSGSAEDFANAYGSMIGNLTEYLGEGEHNAVQQAYNERLGGMKLVDPSMVKKISTTVSGVSKEYDEGNNITVKIGDDRYRVELGKGYDGSFAGTKAANNAGIGDGEIFSYDGELYYKYSDSFVCRIQKRPHDIDGYTPLKEAYGKNE